MKFEAPPMPLHALGHPSRQNRRSSRITDRLSLPVFTALRQGINERPKCLIYVRVSSDQQVKGTSLDTQEEVCRAYAEREGFEVVALFREEGESAKFADRPEFQRALGFLRASNGAIKYFVMYKVDRLSRNILDQATILMPIYEVGAQLRSATEGIDETPIGQFLRNMLWAHADFDNKQRAERCRTGMTARFRQGYWIYVPPPGYIRVKEQGTNLPTLAPDPLLAPLVQLAFRERAKGRSFEAIARLLNLRGWRGRRFGGQLTNRLVEVMLKHPIYIGIMRATGEEVRGRFEPLVSEDLFDRVQAVGRQRSRNTESRAVLNEDFPLRRFVSCGACGTKLTGSFSRGRSRYYAYYHHEERACSGERNITKEHLERAFVSFLEERSPRGELADLAKAEILEQWKARAAGEVEGKKRESARLREVEIERRNLLSLKLKSPGLLGDDEFAERKTALDQEVNALRVGTAHSGVDDNDFEVRVEAVFSLLERLPDAWSDLRIESKIEVQRVLFPDGLVYQNGQLGTANSSLLLAKNSGSAKGVPCLVDLTGPIWNRLREEIARLAEVSKVSGAAVGCDEQHMQRPGVRESHSTGSSTPTSLAGQFIS